MTLSDQWGANRGTLHLILCIIAIVIGVLFYVNAWKVGLDHKSAGVIMATIGILGIV